jgi:carboxypeptidase C (cathepsin A)
MRVFNAGHMVPTDQPEIAMDMIYEFIKNKKLTAHVEKTENSTV